MNGLILLAVLATNPMPDVLRDECDVIEHNAFHDERGRLVFDQMIFYDGANVVVTPLVRPWRLVQSEWQIPVNGVAVWIDGDTMRRVKCLAFVRTWTTHDPELVARERLPKAMRRELLPVKMAINARN